VPERSSGKKNDMRVKGHSPGGKEKQISRGEALEEKEKKKTLAD